MNGASSAIFRFRLALAVFMAGLVMSGLTAFPLLPEMRWLAGLLGLDRGLGDSQAGLAGWIMTVRDGLEEVYPRYPWIAYGTDWLAFALLAIALFFIAPLVDPLSSRANLLAGMAACVGVIPTALICGAIRGVPLTSRLIDCSFGVIGLAILVYCLRLLPRIREERIGDGPQEGR